MTINISEVSVQAIDTRESHIEIPMENKSGFRILRNNDFELIGLFQTVFSPDAVHSHPQFQIDYLDHGTGRLCVEYIRNAGISDKKIRYEGENI